MMMKLVVVIFLLMSLIPSISMGTDYLNGRGRFRTETGDGQEFIKDQLIYQATRDLVKKELQSLGLDSDGFFTAYEEKFESYFSKIELDLRKRYKIDDEKKPSAATMKKFKETLRLRRLKAQASYGQLTSILKKFSHKVSRSTDYPMIRYMNLSAVVDRRRLNEIYRNFMFEGENRQFKYLFLSFDYELIDTSWEDLGVVTKKDFTDVLDRTWKGWFEKMAGENVGEVFVGGPQLVQAVDHYLALPSSGHSGNLTEVATDLGDSGLEILKQGFPDSLWVKMKFVIKKVEEESVLGFRHFQMTSSGMLVDLKRKEPILAFESPESNNRYTTKDPQELSSSVATFLYAQPKKHLTGITEFVSKATPAPKKVDLTITGVPHLGVLKDLQNYFSKTGVTLQVDSRLKTYRKSQLLLELSYRGAEKKFLDLFNSWESAKISDDYSLGKNAEEGLSLDLLVLNSDIITNKEATLNEEDSNNANTQ